MTLREYILSLSQFYRVEIRAAVNASELGLNGMHVRCLHVIANTQECTANCIVKNMGRDKAQIARLVKEMIGKGWLEKQACSQDKRSQILTLSESGSQLQDKINLLEHELERTILAGLSPQDEADFQRIAQRMLANLSHKNVHND
ncbi:MarR family winged helix-turn-helix transcriptional regulator [Teredinibacter haidensis]|uniref:MarR family winged helix-turn-helix transcriptional regulator n=1 Tax=Teredinibacter haidensis TaxID=2731755 RepID=UPI000948DC4E|nr:MarR family transcriptional regulator [Teredinibacter haidensis]